MKIILKYSSDRHKGIESVFLSVPKNGSDKNTS